MRNIARTMAASICCALIGIGVVGGASASATTDVPSTGICYEQVSFQEYRFLKTVTTPAVEEVSHIQYRWDIETRTETFKTQHEIDKYVRDRTSTLSAGVWQNFSPNKDQGKFEGPPLWPTDPRGTWNHEDKPIPPGQAGPDGVYQNGGGNGSWFYRQAGTQSAWSDWSAPYRWQPIGSHLKWVDVVPAANWKSHGTQTKTYQRQWTEYPTGATKQVSTGQTAWVTTGQTEWSKSDTAPADTTTTRHTNRTERTVITTTGADAFDTTYYYVADGAPSTVIGEATWVIENPGQPWVKFDERTSSKDVVIACPLPPVTVPPTTEPPTTEPPTTEPPTTEPPVPSPPVTLPPIVTPPAPTPPVIVPPAITPPVIDAVRPPVAAPPVAADTTLPVTGGSTNTLVFLAAAAIAVGLALTRVNKRR